MTRTTKERKKRDRRQDNPGRPASVGADARLELRIPGALLERVTRAADSAGMDRSMWCRLAFEAALGGPVTFTTDVIDPALVE